MSNDTVKSVEVRTLALSDPWKWLRHGWQDFIHAPRIGLAHGLSITVLGFFFLLLTYDKFWLLAGISTAVLSFAPVVAVGLYSVSRALGKGEEATFLLVFRTWWSWRGRPHHDWRLARFGVLLCLSGTGWVLTSAALVTLFAPEPVNAPLDFLRNVVLSRDNYLFEVWLIVGGILGAPVYASTVVTLPMLLDRRIDILDAVLVSWKVVIQNPQVMAIWAALIMITTMIGVFSLIGSVIIIPVLGHASWHVYRDAVDANQLEPRVPE